jgi:hypothetical protein
MDSTGHTPAQLAAPSRWRRRRAGHRAGHTETAPPIEGPTPEDELVRHHLALADVRGVLDEVAGSVAAVAMLQLVFTNDGLHDIEYRVESLRIDIQNRIADADDLPGDAVVAPGESAIVHCPAVRSVDRTGPSSGNIEYSVVYGRPGVAPTRRFRRQQGIWFRIEADGNGDGETRLRFVERYDEDDPLI